MVASCYQLVAAMLKRDPSASGELWWAIGTGNRAVSVADTALDQEVHRQMLRTSHLSFVQSEGHRVSRATPYLEVATAFRGDRPIGTGGVLADYALTEFGLFGGNATSSPDSGTMINHVVHPPLQLGRGELLERRVILSFGVVDSTASGAGGFMWRGNWDASTAYARNDVVHQSGSAWIAIAGTSVGQVPGTDPAWELLAARGEPGDPGAPGVPGPELYLRDGSRPATGPFRGTRRDLSGSSAPVIDINQGNDFVIELSGPTMASVENAQQGDVFSVLVKQPDAAGAAHTFSIQPPGERVLLKPDDLTSLAVKTGASARTLVTCVIDAGAMIMTATRFEPAS